MIRLIEENSSEGRNELFALNIWWNLNILRDTLRGSGQSNLALLSPTGLSRVYASSQLMCSGKAQNSYSALPALDAPVGFSQDFEDVISFDFSKSLKSCIAPRNLQITLSEINSGPPRFLSIQMEKHQGCLEYSRTVLSMHGLVS